MRDAIAILLLLLAAALPVSSRAAAPLRLIGVARLPPDADAGGWPVGGLSGIDYDARSDTWFVVSDDKSEFGPSRFHAVTLPYDARAVGLPVFSSTMVMRDARGAAFPASGAGAESLDSESIRIDPQGGFVVSSEGDPKDRFGPAIRRVDAQGRVMSQRVLPDLFTFDAMQKTGPRPNRSLEGLSFASDGGLWAAMEAPLFQDAPFPSLTRGAPVRFTLFSHGGARQYVYAVDPLPPQAAGRVADNGVSEILTVDDRHLLVLERSGVRQDDGDFHFFVRLYCASTENATEVSAMPSLAGRDYRVLRKRLVFDFAALAHPPSDNVEGMTWGRRLGNGNRSLVFVTDNNFSPRHASQFEVFEVESGARAVQKALGCP
ncbi:MAG TPA: esterase-like activity of phytase family protein [Rhizomicrobium sp.]